MNIEKLMNPKAKKQEQQQLEMKLSKISLDVAAALKRFKQDMDRDLREYKENTKKEADEMYVRLAEDGKHSVQYIHQLHNDMDSMHRKVQGEVKSIREQLDAIGAQVTQQADTPQQISFVKKICDSLIELVTETSAYGLDENQG